MHWAHRPPFGDQQLTFNYVQAFSDKITHFTFGKGVFFNCAKQYKHIVPALLNRVWEVDNNKPVVLAEIGQQGSVTGDAFVKVAYDPAWTDPAGNFHPGRVRVLPLASAHCLTPDVEILTKDGWKTYDQVNIGDEVASLDPETDELVWTTVEYMNVINWEGKLAHWKNERFDVLSTPDHRWVHKSARGKMQIRTTDALHNLKGGGAGSLVVAGGASHLFAESAKYSDELIELIGWFVTEGSWNRHSRDEECAGFHVTQNIRLNPGTSERIRALVHHFQQQGYHISEGRAREDGCVQWYFGAKLGREVLAPIVGPDKELTPEFLNSLTLEQAELLYEILMVADGHRGAAHVWAQSNEDRVDSFQMLAMMLGKRTQARWRQRAIGKPCSDVTVYQNRTLNIQNLDKEWVDYKGIVWCPTTGTGTWIARRKGTTFITGNCFPEWHPHDADRLLRFKLKYRFWTTNMEGTRQVMTYTEVLTADTIQEFINDELIDERPNPLGVIPVVHIPNIKISGSPWGLSDIENIVPLNREYNEKSAEISDIINYHSAPVTVITGAKPNNLEKGPRKIWAIATPEAKIYNLENAVDLQFPLEYLDRIKTAMHEMAGVPEAALGQMQPISNTSGVALAIQYGPLVEKREQKVKTYSVGLQQINELILRTLWFFEPETLVYDPDTDGIIEDGQPYEVDPADPLAYQTECSWPPPLPVDKLVKLNELQLLMVLGLESKRGALQELGCEFPDEKALEIFEEQKKDALENGALDMLRAEISSAIVQMTGMTPSGENSPEPLTGTTSNSASSTPANPVASMPVVSAGIEKSIMTELVAQAHGSRTPKRRNPDNDTD